MVYVFAGHLSTELLGAVSHWRCVDAVGRLCVGRVFMFIKGKTKHSRQRRDRSDLAISQVHRSIAACIINKL